MAHVDKNTSKQTTKVQNYVLHTILIFLKCKHMFMKTLEENKMLTAISLLV